MDLQELNKLVAWFRTMNYEMVENGADEKEFEEKAGAFIRGAEIMCENGLIGRSFAMTDSERKTLMDELRGLVYINVDKGGQIDDHETKPWVDGRWRALGNNRMYWQRYKRRLEHDLGRPAKVVNDIDKVTDEILDQCGDPTDCSMAWQKRGMVIGEVQSGKTGVFAGLMNKAADAGYKVFIVLAGLTNSLREQTQRRIDSDFLGRESKLHSKIRLGNAQTVICLTSVKSDFFTSKKDISFPLNGNTGTALLVVVKKNKVILDNMFSWLQEESKKSMDGKRIESSLFLIDDEADSASINTNANDKEATAINNRIRDILALFKNASYVGFTATPYANIFINPYTPEGKTDDLFPRNFIRYTSIPSNYFGIRRMLDADEAHDEDPTKPWIVREINDAEASLPLKHKMSYAQDILLSGWNPPESLLRAIRQFLIVNTVLDLRGRNTQHRTMMINVSRFTRVQDNLRERISSILTAMVGELSQRARSLYKKKESAEIKALREVYEEDFVGVEFEWKQLLEQLPHSLQGIKVSAVNQSSADQLDYSAYSKNGLRVIAVGGLTLSRGITLEGLCVTYLYRSTAAYDTLTQMGRWFGYRGGYEDLCRIWISNDTLTYFREIYKAMCELQSEIEEMKRRYSRPIDFGLKVLNSPEALLITSRNKMRDSKDLVVQCSLDKYFVETPRIHFEDVAPNKKTLNKFLESLTANGARRTNWLDQDSKIWFHDVPKDLVADFVRDFKAEASSRLLYHFDDDENGMANFIANNDYECLKFWDVTIWGNDKDRSAVAFEIRGDTSVSPIKRSMRADAYGDGLYVCQKNRISGPEIEEVGLDKSQIELVRNKPKDQENSETKSKETKRLMCRRLRTRPLLVIMPLKPVLDDDKTVATADWIPTYALSFCAFDDTASEKRKMAKYKVNNVWLAAYEDEGDIDG